MSDDHSPEAVRQHVRTYINVFVALAVLTVLTVAVSYIHLPHAPATLVALFIAAVKGALVALFFMHLRSEKIIIRWILALAFFFFLFLLICPTLHHA